MQARHIILWILVFAASACATAGGDEPGAPDGGTDAAAAPDASAAPDAAASPDAPTTADADVAEEPAITQVAWEWVNCDVPADTEAAAQRSISITTTVSDPDTPPDVLTYAGVVAGCGGFAGNPALVPCAALDPSLPPVPVDLVTVSVTDAEGGGDQVSFSAPACTAGAWVAP